MGVLAAKIVLAPAFVVGASLAARRYGARTGGLIGGLPVVAGPISLVFALEHGRAFASNAATGTLLGTVSLTMFVLVYAHLAGRKGWGASLLAGWVAFFAMTAALSALTVSAATALAVALTAVAATMATLPRAGGELAGATDRPGWDLPLRALSALALVMALTALAGQLGPGLSGLLAPFPVVASVLAVFTHALHGQEELLRIMRGFVIGLVAYSLFFFALAQALGSSSIAAGFALAGTVSLLTQAVALTLSSRRREPAVEPA